MKVEKKYSQGELLRGIRNGNNEILKLVYSDNFNSVFHWIAKNSGNESDARDVFQDALVILYRNINRPGFKLTSSLGTYIFSIAKLVWLRELRNRRRSPEKLEADENLSSSYPGIHEEIEYNERVKLYREKFEELSDDCRKVLRMFLNRIAISDITKAMGYSSDQHTKNRRYRCKMSLINKIRKSKRFNELVHGNTEKDSAIPRW